MKRSYYHRGDETPLLGVTIPQRLRTVGERLPDREAVVSRQQQRHLTYAQLEREVDALARGLLGLGVVRGSRVGVWSTNNLEWLLLQLATARIGAIQVNLNPAYRPAELAYALQRSRVEYVFTIPAFKTSRYVEMLVEVVPELASSDGARPNGPAVVSESLPDLQRVVVYDPAAPQATPRPHPGFTVWPEVLAAGESVEPSKLESATAALDPDDPINIQYTSGTTGHPKPVVLTHHNILNNAYFIGQAMRFSETDTLCLPVPFYHCFGMVIGNLLCLSIGARIVIPSEFFDPESTLAAVDEERCTALHGVPTMFIAELEHPDFADFDLSSLRTGVMAGATCPPALVERVIDEMGCREILIAYGQTEASPGTHITAANDSIERRTTTVGRNLPHQEVKIVDTESGAIVPLGVPGEICFRGYHVMRGYYDDDEATDEAIDEAGWLHSGDLGTMDADGYVQITGRLKNMIIRGGENIYPREVEDFLFNHEKIADVAVFGVPHDVLGEEVVAWIVLHAGETSTEEEIVEYCRDEIAHFKIPTRIRFVDELPMTVTGKVQKYRLQEMEVEKLEEAAS